MYRFIQLHRTEDQIMRVQIQHIVAYTQAYLEGSESGSYLYFVTSTTPINVEETPEEIDRLLNVFVAP